MIKKELILKSISKLEDKLLVSKVLDKVAKSEAANSYAHSDFLDPYQRSLVHGALEHIKGLRYTFWGGYDGAERAIVVFHPDFAYEDEMHDQNPLRLLTIADKSREELSHRDYLGALMSLGIKREKIGDIVVRKDERENSCSVIVLSDIADYICYNLSRIGRARVSVSVEDTVNMEDAQKRVKEINATVASLRLDCVASAGFGISRSKICDYIRAERVNLNWEMSSSPTKQVKQGDIISIRGQGRVAVEDIGGNTRKDRIRVFLKKFV
ncbi:RNA-binding protein YlmH [Anaerobacterium chartisolvens]|uniref:RNA-binding protein YlmH n=1 Tax=Anaerobacterium chartisolvens TaxID=1297424 RepID=A0A369B5N3_9FIRM|nr:YlmH/Sll1252 family protein [Anaerobacterium chartisolvens]RCX16822.1 RNA-binding protein YlmH [Anaerobacterium chartisolvens]